MHIEVFHNFSKLRNSTIMEENVRFEGGHHFLRKSNLFFHYGEKLRNLANVKDLYSQNEKPVSLKHTLEYPSSKNQTCDLQGSIYGVSISFSVDEIQGTSTGIHLATLSTWPAPSRAFQVQFKLKLVTISGGVSNILHFSDTGTKRLPSFFIQNDQIYSSFRRRDNFDHHAMLTWHTLALNQYHFIKLEQVLVGDQYKVRLYFNGVLMAERLNEIPDIVYSNVKVTVAKARSNAVFYLKELDYSVL